MFRDVKALQKFAAAHPSIHNPAGSTTIRYEMRRFERRLVTEDGLLGTVRTGSVRHGGVPGSRTVRDLRGRVTWHDSDRFGGTVRARESGQMRPESGVRCR